MARILSLEDRARPATARSTGYWRTATAGVRRRAALAAGRIGDASMAPALVARMNDTEPEVRQMSAFALGLLGDPLAAERLVAALTDADPIVRARSVEALGRVGGPRAAPASSRSFARRCRRTRRSSPSAATTRAARTIPGCLPRLALFALVRLKDVAGGRVGAARGRTAALRLVGRHLGGHAARERRR